MGNVLDGFVEFKVHSGVRCGRIKAMVADQVGICPLSSRLLFDCWLAPDDTLGELGLKDGDVMDFVKEQAGC
jgi:hypothetical protein